MRGLGVPARVQRGVCGEATRADHARQGLLAGGRRERRRRVASGAHPGPGARVRPVDPPPLQGPCGQGHHAVLTPLALSDPAQQALGGEVRDRPRRPCPSAPPTRREHRQPPAGCRAVDPGQQGAPGLRTPHDGPCVAGPGPDAREDRPRARPRALVAAADPRELEASRALGDRLLREPGADGWPARLVAQVLGRPAVVWSQVCDGVASAGRGPGGQAPAWSVFPQTASARRHRHPPVRGAHRGANRSTRLRTLNDRSARRQRDRSTTRPGAQPAGDRAAVSFNNYCADRVEPDRKEGTWVSVNCLHRYTRGQITHRH